jgi:hypothetical protein
MYVGYVKRHWVDVTGTRIAEVDKKRWMRGFA